MVIHFIGIFVDVSVDVFFPFLSRNSFLIKKTTVSLILRTFASLDLGTLNLIIIRFKKIWWKYQPYLIFTSDFLRLKLLSTLLFGSAVSLRRRVGGGVVNYRPAPPPPPPPPPPPRKDRPAFSPSANFFEKFLSNPLQTF